MNLREVLSEEKIVERLDDSTEASILINLAKINKRLHILLMLISQKKAQGWKI